MRRWLCLLLLPLLLPLQAQAGAPQLRLLREPPGTLVPGQSLELQVQLLVPSYFLAAPAFPELQLDDGSRAQPGDSRNLNLRIDGEAYAGIQRSYRFAPLPAGQYRLRAQSIALRYADPQSHPQEARLSLPELLIEVAQGGASQPRAGQAENGPQLRLGESLQPSGPLHAGDILLRELRIELHDAGDLLPPAPDIAEVAGARLYRSAPELSQDRQRGARLSVREEQLRYLLLTPGTLELPAVRLQWRDTRSGQLQQVELPARRLQVLARTAQAPGGTPAWLWPGALFVVLLGVTASVLGRAHLRARWNGHRRWHALRRAARLGDAAAAEQALGLWLDSLPERSRQVVLAGLGEALDDLYRARYAAQPTPWQGAALLRRAARLRATGPAATSERLRLNP